MAIASKTRGYLEKIQKSQDQAIKALEENAKLKDSINKELEITLSDRSEKIVESEKRYKQTFETNQAVKLIINPSDGSIVEANDAACSFYGYSKNEIMSLKISDINALPPDKVRDAMSGTKTENKKVFNFLHRLASGEVRDVEVFSGPINYGQEIFLHSIIVDITDRKRAEKLLRESEEKYRKLVSNISDVIVILDKEGVITYKSPNITEQFGWVPGDLIGKHGLFTTHPDDQERIGEELTRILKKDYATVQVEYNYLCKDGSFKPVELRAVNMVSDPIINGVLANYKDITHRIQADKELRKSEEKFRSTFRTSPDAINLNTVEGGVYIDINEGFTKIMGYSREDVIGKASVKLNIWKDFKDRERLISGLQKYGVVENLEAEFIGKDGQIRTGLMSARIISIDNKDTILSITRDITGQRKLEAQIRQSQKMESIGTLAGGIAHDFNNILFPIVGHTEMLLEDTPEDSPFRASLNEIYTGSLRARDLVHQILAFSRQGTNDLKLMKMHPIIKEALKLIRSTIPTTISINQNLQSDCGAIKADPTKIHQIVMNLATNAYHAMEENGGELKVTLKEIQLGEHELIIPDMKSGSYACLTIADTGSGMDKQLTDKIFEPFFTTKEIGKGTGMGLSVVYGIIKNMNGAINVYSEPGEGTQFSVYLPLAEAVKEQQATKVEALIQGGIEQILLVDDEEAILKMGKQALERLGYQVTSRTSSIEALEAFRASPDKFDMVITDMAMPNMSGDKLSIELTKIRPDIPVLLCTGFSETMSEEKAASLGIKGFLLKPIVMKDLSQKIREVLDKN